MDKFIYKRAEDAREAQKIEFDIPDDLTCQEFRTMCIRMAQALGYQEETIINTFGELEKDDVRDEFETFISKQLKKNTVVVDKKQLKLLFDWKDPKYGKKDK